MKIQYLFLTLLIISCRQKPHKDQTTTHKEEQRTAVDSTTLRTAVNIINEEASLSFDEALNLVEIKELPQIETTNFDSFIEEEDYDDVDVQLFKLESIYPDFYKEGYNYRAIAQYSLALSNDFYSVVVTIKKGDNEMESVLINYSKTGSIIDYKVVSYDEIAEGMSRIVSRISENKLTVHEIFWEEIKQIRQIEYTINTDGKIERINTTNLNEDVENFTLVNSAVMDLNLDWVQLKTDLIAVKPWLDNANESIVVIPEIEDEGEYHLELNSHLVVINTTSAKVTHKHYESSQTNTWVSDAVRLDKISIDTVDYQVQENTNAFGLRVDYIGSSKANPYENQTLSLFMKSGDSLKKILNNYSVEDYGGERITDCEGEFLHSTKTVIVSENRTNDYFDFVVENKIIEIVTAQDSDGDCNSEETTTLQTATLQFNGKTYSENKL